MQAIILSAGRGQRLAPLTDATPKPLIEVGGKALIEYHLIKLSSIGIESVVINTGWLGQQIIDKLGNGDQYGLRIDYSIEPENALETAGGIKQALELIDGEQFLVCNADVYHEFDLNGLMIKKLMSKQAHLFLINNPEHNLKGDFSIVKGNLHNKSDSHKSYTYSGIGLYSRSFFSDLGTGKASLGPLLRAKAESELISAEIVNETWFDIGTLERMQELNNYLKSN